MGGTSIYAANLQANLHLNFEVMRSHVPPGHFLGAPGQHQCCQPVVGHVEAVAKPDIHVLFCNGIVIHLASINVYKSSTLLQSYKYDNWDHVFNKWVLIQIYSDCFCLRGVAKRSKNICLNSQTCQALMLMLSKMDQSPHNKRAI